MRPGDDPSRSPRACRSARPHASIAPKKRVARGDKREVGRLRCDHREAAPSRGARVGVSSQRAATAAELALCEHRGHRAPAFRARERLRRLRRLRRANSGSGGGPRTPACAAAARAPAPARRSWRARRAWWATALRQHGPAAGAERLHERDRRATWICVKRPATLERAVARRARRQVEARRAEQYGGRLRRGSRRALLGGAARERAAHRVSTPSTRSAWSPADRPRRDRAATRTNACSARALARVERQRIGQVDGQHARDARVHAAARRTDPPRSRRRTR